GVEATAIGTFEVTGKLQLRYEGQQVGDLDMRFLHHGRPPLVRKATLARSAREGGSNPSLALRASKLDCSEILLKILMSLNVCSKEWIIRQYDHEVQGGSVVKPLVGVRDDGPSDAAVIMPLAADTPPTTRWRGLAVGCGINPRYGDLDPY